MAIRLIRVSNKLLSELLMGGVVPNIPDYPKDMVVLDVGRMPDDGFHSAFTVRVFSGEWPENTPEGGQYERIASHYSHGSQ